MNDFFAYVAEHAGEIGMRFAEHCGIVAAALVVAIPVGAIAGIILSREGARRVRTPLFYLLGLGQTIPSLAVLALAVGLLGIGWFPAVTALVLYSILPVARNTFAGIRAVPFAATDAARGMGMTPKQILRRVELPLALPYIIAGTRTATVVAISAAALASLVGAGGLGDLIFAGINLYKPEAMLAGAIPTALLAIAADRVLATVERNAGRRA